MDPAWILHAAEGTGTRIHEGQIRIPMLMGSEGARRAHLDAVTRVLPEASCP